MVYAYDPIPDPVAIELATEGQKVRLTPLERAEAIRRLNGRGLSDPKIAATIGCTPRAVLRIRQRVGIPAFRPC